jgi:hypothetical protein
MEMKKTSLAMLATFALFFAAAGLVMSGAVPFGLAGDAQSSPMDDSQTIPVNDPHEISDLPYFIPVNDPHCVDWVGLTIPVNDPH